MAAISVFLLVLSATCSVHAVSRVFRIYEGPSAAYLGNIAQTTNLTALEGCSQLSSLRYSLISQEDGYHLLFKINETTGYFSTAVALDRENIPMCAYLAECSLHVSVAVQSATGTCFQRVSIFVIIIDVNDNAPDFKQPIIRRDLYENAPVGAELSLPLAHDKDANTAFKIQRYTLSPSWSPFTLIYSNLQDGSVSLTLRLSALLDREKVSEYTLHVTAYDGGTPPRGGTMLVIVLVRDINDNAPFFTKDNYEVAVPENSKIGSTVLFLSATDLDVGKNGVVTYDFANPKQDRLTKHFVVDPKTGSIYTKGSLENEGGSVFNFTVEAVDGGSPVLSSEANVLISVLDTGNNKPQIIIQLLFSENGSATVPESAIVGRVVALVTVRDTDHGDNGKVHCSSANTNFRLQLLESEYKVVVAFPLDRELVPFHEVIITCQDSGTPPLKSSKLLLVKVLDSNDNSPQFLQTLYVMSIEENNDFPILVGRVSATDRDVGQNADISYTIPDSFNDTIKCREASGEIFVNKRLDREKHAQYFIRVEASDHGSLIRTGHSVIVLNVQDQNDNNPQFLNASYTYYIKENVLINSQVGLLIAKDVDEGLNGEVIYYLKGISESGVLPFHLLDNGSLVSFGELDYESERSYNFDVFAVDRGIPARTASVSVTVVVLDENDHSPIITFPGPDNSSVSIPYTTEAGTEVAVIQAHDLDTGVNGEMEYSMNGSDVFLVDAHRGIISLRGASSSEIRTYQLSITVRDRGVPALSAEATLTVLVNFDDHTSDGYVQIVIVIVCVTLLLVVGVTTVLCFLRYTDKQNLKNGAITRYNFMSHFTNSIKSGRKQPKTQRPGIIVLGESNKFSKKTVTFKTNSPKIATKNDTVKCENCKYQILKKNVNGVCCRCGAEKMSQPQKDDFNMKQLDVNSLRTTSRGAEDDDSSRIQTLTYHQALVRSMAHSQHSQARSADIWFNSYEESITTTDDTLQLRNDVGVRHNQITV